MYKQNKRPLYQEYKEAKPKVEEIIIIFKKMLFPIIKANHV
jgi:hypothetical protein